jgi:hypothetical protein
MCGQKMPPLQPKLADVEYGVYSIVDKRVSVPSSLHSLIQEFIRVVPPGGEATQASIRVWAHSPRQAGVQHLENVDGYHHSEAASSAARRKTIGLILPGVPPAHNGLFEIAPR